MFPELTPPLGFINQQTVQRFWHLDFGIKKGFVAQYCVFLGCLYLYINSTCGFQSSYIFLLNSDHGWCWPSRVVQYAPLVQVVNFSFKWFQSYES